MNTKIVLTWSVIQLLFIFSCQKEVANAEEISMEFIPTRAALRADVTVDNHDNVYALYRDKSPEENRLLSRSAEDTIWTAAVTTTAHSDINHGQRQPSIIASPNGQLYYGYRWMEGGPSDRRLAIKAYNVKNDSWEQEYKIVCPQKPWGPQLAVDGDGEVHMVWGAGYEPNAQTYYRAPNGKITPIVKG